MRRFRSRPALDDLSDTFAACLASARTNTPAVVIVGIEHEYEVRHEGDQVAFESLIDRLQLGRRHLDPADANAFRLRSGAAITCDEHEAELALPPVEVRAGFVADVLTRIAADEAALRARLPEFELVGVSTHVSVSVDASIDRIDALARLYAETFAPALMLLLDRRDSWGLWVRPRPGRLELCADFARGDRLGAAMVLAVGSVRACVAALAAPAGAAPLPPRIALRVDPAVHRFGYTVWRTCGGGDLYAGGRAAAMELASGGTITAQAQLESAWHHAHGVLPQLSQHDLAPIESFVTGDAALPVADDPPLSPLDRLPVAPTPSPFGLVVEPVRRASFELAPVMLSWPVVVLLAATLPRQRRAFVCIPGPNLAAYLTQLEAGALDGVIDAYLRGRPRRRRLARIEQTTAPGIYDELGPRRSLLPSEPSPAPEVVAAR